MESILRQTPHGFTVTGVLDFQHVLQVRDLGLQWLRVWPVADIEIDLANTVCDSAGLAVCVAWWREAVKNHKQIIWRQVLPDVRTLARAYGLETILGLERPI